MTALLSATGTAPPEVVEQQALQRLTEATQSHHTPLNPHQPSRLSRSRSYRSNPLTNRLRASAQQFESTPHGVRGGPSGPRPVLIRVRSIASVGPGGVCLC